MEDVGGSGVPLTDDDEAKGGGRRKVVNADNDIDLILAGRAKKHSVVIPHVSTAPGKRLRHVFLGEKDYNHLMGEVTGEKYDNPCRAELELLTVGLDEKDSLAADQLSLLYDHPKNLFILSRHVEDLLLCRLKDKPVNKYVILRSTVKVGWAEFSELDPFRQKLFRRFVREYFLPLLADEVRVAQAVERIATHYYQHQEGIESDSESSAASEEQKAAAVKKKPTKPSLRGSKIVKSGVVASRATSISKDSSGGKRAQGSSGGGGAVRRTISSFSKK